MPYPGTKNNGGASVVWCNVWRLAAAFVTIAGFALVLGVAIGMTLASGVWWFVIALWATASFSLVLGGAIGMTLASVCGGNHAGEVSEAAQAQLSLLAARNADNLRVMPKPDSGRVLVRSTAPEPVTANLPLFEVSQN